MIVQRRCIRLRAFALGVFVWLCLVGDAWSQINVNNVIVTFRGGQRPVQNLFVTNSSDKPVYVTVNVEEMYDFSKDPVEGRATDKILVSPRQFSVEPKGQRTVRLLLKSPNPEIEQGYRVYFVPQENEFAAPVSSELVKGRTAVITVLTGVGVLVFAEPIKINADLQHTRDSAGITFSNKGNLQVFFSDGVACSKGSPFPPAAVRSKEEILKHGCQPLPSKRLYAGQSFRVPVSGDKDVRYLKKNGAAGMYEQMELKSGA